MKRNAIVLGASSGIGAELSRYLAEKDWNVIGIGSRDLSGWVVTNGLTKKQLDLSDWASYCKFLDTVFEDQDAPELVINTIGRSDNRLFIQSKNADLDQIIEHNFKLPILAQNEFVKRASLQKKPITSVLLSSMSTHVIAVGNSLYAATKSALTRAHAGMALEYHRYGHVFYTISISLIEESPMVQQLPISARENYEKRLFFPHVSQRELNEFVGYLAVSRPKALSGTEVAFGGLI